MSSMGIQLVHNIRALLPVWWCDHCGRWQAISCVLRTPFHGRLVTELLCRRCHERELREVAALTSRRRSAALLPLQAP